MNPKPNTEDSSIKVVDLWGSLTVSTVEKLKRMVGQASNGNDDEIVLNFEAVDRVDSSGLGAIISCYITLHRKKKKLSLVNLNDRVKEIFFYTHLSKIVNIYEESGEIIA